MKGFKPIRVFLLLSAVACSSSLARAQARPQPTPALSEEGILLMAHGGSEDWNDMVKTVAAEVDKQIRTEVAFGMADRSTLQRGVDKLAARGVKQIIAVPLFISSYSSVIESTKYLLGLRPDAPKELTDFAMHADMPGMGQGSHTSADTSTPKTAEIPQPIYLPLPLRMTSALDRDSIVAAILADRAAAIAKNPSRDVVIFVAHGPNDDAENAKWLANMQALAAQIPMRASYARIECFTLRDDAEPPVRDAATAGLRKAAQEADDAGYHVLIVPLLLSYGGIENGIRKRLDGIEHTMSPEALLPDPRIAQWALKTARAAEERP